MLASLLLCCLSQSPPSAGKFTDEFGESLARVEHTGSKEPDWLAVGSPSTYGGEGASAIYCFGGSAHALRWTFKSPPRIGYRLTELGDMDGDSVTDLLAIDRGEIVVLSGAKGTKIDALPGLGSDRYGPLAPIQGPDGVCIVTGQCLPNEPRTPLSCVSLRSKKELWTFEQADLTHLSLTCVVRMTDVDHDGVEEVLVGYGDSTPTHFREQAERVVCLSGASGKQLFEVCGPAGDRLGFSISECGDWNGDGIADFVAGAPKLGLRGNTIAEDYGYTCVCSGRDGAILNRVEPVAKCAGLGNSIVAFPVGAGAGPRSFLVAAYGHSVDGAVFVCSPDKKEPRRLCAKDWLTDFGYLVRSIGDQDGDSNADFAVASTPPVADSMDDGSVGVYSSKDGKELYVLRRPKD